MKVYVVLISYTQQGVEALKEAPLRTEKFTDYLTSKGVSNVTIYWTFDAYDGVVTLPAPGGLHPSGVQQSGKLW